MVLLTKSNWLKLALATSAITVTAGGLTMLPALAAANPPLTIEAEEVAAWQDNFNPFALNNQQVPDGVIYESLFYFSTTGPTYPLLGTSYKWNADNKVLTVMLRHNVKWDDGMPFTSADVVFSYTLLKRFPALDTNLVWQDIKSVTAKGPYSVQFTFAKVDVPFAQILLGQIPIVPAKIWSKVANPSKWLDPNPVGTGPYELDHFSTQDYTLKANSAYWGGVPPVPELNYPALSGNDSADLELAAGKLDWSGLFVPNINNLYVNKSPATNKYWFPPVGDVSIYPNLSNPILKSVAVREAISLAINRQQIYQIGEYGYEQPANPTGLVLPSETGWLSGKVPAADRSFAMNIQKANSLLQQAGWKMGSGGIREKAGKPLVLNLIAPAGWTDWNKDQSLIATDLQSVGIKVNVDEIQQGDWQSQLQSHTFQLALESSFVITGSTPFYGYFNVLDPKGWENYEGFSDPSVTAALSAFKHSSSKAQQEAAMATVETTVANQLPVIPLVYAANWYEYNTTGYTGWPSAQNPYVDSPPYNGFSTGIVLMHLKPAK